MALSTPTTLNTASSTTNNATIATASVSPTGGALLVAIVADMMNSALTHDSMSAGFSITGSWTKHGEIQVNNGTQFLTVSVWTAVAAVTPGSGTLTCTLSGASRDKTIFLYEVTGQDATTPVAQTKTNSAASGSTLSITLDSTPAATSMVVGGLVALGSSNDIAPGTNFTELAEVDTGTNASAVDSQAQYDLTSATTTCDWSNLSGLQAGVAIEIAEASTGITITMDTLTLASSAVTMDAVPGAVSVTMDALTLAGSPVALTVDSTVSILLDTLTLASSPVSLSVLVGAVSVLLDTLTLAGSPVALTVSAGGGAQTVTMNTLSLVGSPVALTVLKGGVTILLDSLTLASSPVALSVIPGAISVLLDALTLAGSTPQIDIGAGTFISLNTLTLASSPVSLAVVAGAISVLLDTLALTGSAENMSVVPGGVTLPMDTLNLASSPQALTVSSVVTIPLDTLALVSSAISLAVVPGATIVQLNTLTLASSLVSLAVLAAGIQLYLDLTDAGVGGLALSESLVGSVSIGDSKVPPDYGLNLNEVKL